MLGGDGQIHAMGKRASREDAEIADGWTDDTDNICQLEC